MAHEHSTHTVRSVRQIQSTLTTLPVSGDPCAWLKAQARPGMRLLAHADDGVIWAIAGEQALTFPADTLIDQAALRAPTLIWARLFDRTQEIFLWRVAEGRWAARRIADDVGEVVAYIDEPHLLWGTAVVAAEGAFTRVAEGQQGLEHAFPAAIAAEKLDDAQRLHLDVRHYLAEEEDTGWQRIAYSRLTGATGMEETTHAS